MPVIRRLRRRLPLVLLFLSIAASASGCTTCGAVNCDDVVPPEVVQPKDEVPAPKDPVTQPPADPVLPPTHPTPPRNPLNGLRPTTYTVTLAGTTARVTGNGPGAGSGTYTVEQCTSGGCSGTGVIYLKGDATVSGNTSGRITIVARDQTGQRAADIVVDGNIRTNTANAAIGLVAQGNVIVRAYTCRASQIDAAIFAETGALEIEPDYLTPVPLRIRAPEVRQCGTLTINGSVASHRAPQLYWDWPGYPYAGYRVRRYTWNTNLLRNPPPFFPTAEDWKPTLWTEANANCLNTGNQSTCT